MKAGKKQYILIGPFTNQVNESCENILAVAELAVVCSACISASSILE